MEISILHLTEGARKAEGLTVIIDVFRAFSLECYLYANGAKLVIPVLDISDAWNLKQKYPEIMLIGERNEMMIEGFDFGNSPNQILKENLIGKTIVHTTSAGTKGIINATGASEIITGSFVNAGAIIKYIQKSNSQKISLVCMGYSALEKTEEDTLCAEYIYNKLKGRSVDFPNIINIIRNTSGQRFFDPSKAAYSPKEDFNLCLDLDRFDFIIRAEKQEGGLIFNKKIADDK
jgi:2-phosphosulfolactate phosphatase